MLAHITPPQGDRKIHDVYRKTLYPVCMHTLAPVMGESRCANKKP